MASEEIMAKSEIMAKAMANENIMDSAHAAKYGAGSVVGNIAAATAKSA
jgi:hypothetical protein